QAVLARRGVDPRDPERPEHALAGAAITVGILPRLHHRLLGDAEDVAAAAAVAFGLGEDLLVARLRDYASLDSWHVFLRFRRRASWRGHSPYPPRAPARRPATGACSWWSSW